MSYYEYRPPEQASSEAALNKVDAALVFVYFVGDTTVSGTEPVSREGWGTAIDLATHHLGIRSHIPWIRDNAADVFIDVDDLAPRRLAIALSVSIDFKWALSGS